jgi:hypothetical protein
MSSFSKEGRQKKISTAAAIKVNSSQNSITSNSNSNSFNLMRIAIRT